MLLIWNTDSEDNLEYSKLYAHVVDVNASVF